MAAKSKKGDVSLEELNQVLHSENEELRKKLKKVEDELQYVKSENELLRKEKDRAVERLTEEWSAKVGANEKNVENINIKNRPVTVATKYEMLSCTTWLDAKTSIDQIAGDLSEENKLKILADVLLTAYSVAAETYKQVTSKIYGLIFVHIEFGTTDKVEEKAKENAIVLAKDDAETGRHLTGSEYMKVCDAMPSNLRNSIGDFLRSTCDSTDISAITVEITKKLIKNFNSSLPKDTKSKDEKEEKHKKDVLKYIEDCGRLAWSMVAQRPPMVFDNTSGVGEKYKGDKVQNLQYGSDNPDNPESVVKLYVHPALLHDDRIMVRGRVLVKKKEDKS